MEPDDMDALILCGGFGKRLKSIVSDRPKPMADINGRPFLDILIDYVASFGFRRFILSIGDKAEFIKNYYLKKETAAEILFCEEKEALGTAGAVKNAERIIKSSPFLVMNGDSFCEIDFNKFCDFHLSKKADLSIVALTRRPGESEYGVIKLCDTQRVIAFQEKSEGKGFLNAGIYLFEKKILSLIMPGRNTSLEEEFFPGFLDKGNMYGYIVDTLFLEIGTPERLAQARMILKS